jgi:hypothetical protein
MPWIDTLWVKNPWISRLRAPSWSAMGDFAVKRQNERLALNEKSADVNSRDFLSRFIQQIEKDPTIPKWCVDDCVLDSPSRGCFAFVFPQNC